MFRKLDCLYVVFGVLQKPSVVQYQNYSCHAYYYSRSAGRNFLIQDSQKLIVAFLLIEEKPCWEKMRRRCLKHIHEFIDDTATKENSHTRLLLIICSISFFCPVAIGSKHTKFGNPPELAVLYLKSLQSSKHTKFGNPPEQTLIELFLQIGSKHTKFGNPPEPLPSMT